MAAVNNATGVYATLGYNFTDPNNNIQTFDANTQNNLVQFPAVIEPWQAQDITNNTTSGYFQNPVSTYVNTIITVSGQIFTAANSANIFTIAGVATTLGTTASSFLTHTNKVSGVTPMTGQSDTLTQPYYQTAVSYGKQAIMIVNQTDGVVNNSPILGSMTSLLVPKQISDYANTLSSDLIILNAAISANNLTPSQETQIITDLTTTNSFLSTRQSSDLTFFQKVSTLITNYNTTQQFSNMGDTEKYLCNNIVGTSKLVSRINS
jgi:hypothetical protein